MVYLHSILGSGDFTTIKAVENKAKPQYFKMSMILNKTLRSYQISELHEFK